MKLADLFEDEDDWEAEVADEPWKSFKVQPREGTSGWTSFAATSMVFDLAFGVGKWGQSGIPSKGTFAPMKVSIHPDVKINYAPLRDNGYKIVFLEGEELEYRKVHVKEDMPDRIRLEKSFYMERRTGAPWLSYNIKQWLEDEDIGRVTLIDSINRDDGSQNCSWSLTPNSKRFEGINSSQMSVGVSCGQLYNALKLKWWVTNRLIDLKLLPPKTVREDKREPAFGKPKLVKFEKKAFSLTYDYRGKGAYVFSITRLFNERVSAVGMASMDIPGRTDNEGTWAVWDRHTGVTKHTTKVPVTMLHNIDKFAAWVETQLPHLKGIQDAR